ncbi:hypothetical protein X949_5452 [Burkholderia pseudomallei MSHR5609]|nr:hypothetical protein X949_5452 [Burkholderia pseudomallei MSHR5609]
MRRRGPPLGRHGRIGSPDTLGVPRSPSLRRDRLSSSAIAGFRQRIGTTLSFLVAAVMRRCAAFAPRVPRIRGDECLEVDCNVGNFGRDDRDFFVTERSTGKRRNLLKGAERTVRRNCRSHCLFVHVAR